ncbi:hypothetical protein AB0N16_24095 [Streptomyces sp. NPDC051105]|uniref:hypothetical protein n=1 Tax=Streptomyces sp. NPDC051105 TaxID=3154843 RepID=UPI0034209B0A
MSAQPEHGWGTTPSRRSGPWTTCAARSAATVSRATASDSAEAITVVHTHASGMGVTVVYYFRDPRVVD